MSLPRASPPRRGCPFVGKSSPGSERPGAECVGEGRCGGCERLRNGTPIGLDPRYRVVGFLASGYYADVFQATDLASGGDIALKVYADEPPKREAWRREQESLAQLVHRRIPRLRGALEGDGWLIVAMDFVPGVDLRELVVQRGPLGDAAAGLLAGVAEALDHLASLGWTYRDLHPRNIHLGTPVGAMLLDFDGARPPGCPAYPSGRIGYRAPELELDNPVTPACDVYSLAGCVYFALTGEDPPSTAGRLLLGNRLPPDSRLAGVLDRCRADDPELRPSIKALGAALHLATSD